MAGRKSMNTGDHAFPSEAHEEEIKPAYWKPGYQIVLYEMWGQGIGAARPVTVVEDLSPHMALYSHPRTPFISRGIENRRSLSLPELIDLYIKTLDPSVGEFADRLSPDRHVLTLTPPDAWHSVWLSWSVEWEFRNWYVNFQAPICRVPRGVQVHDYALDIVVKPDMPWSWKDEDEFDALVARGFFSDEQVSSIRDAAGRVVKVIESGGSPLCDGWENWRADERWPEPRLPVDWLECTEPAAPLTPL